MASGGVACGSGNLYGGRLVRPRSRERVATAAACVECGPLTCGGSWRELSGHANSRGTGMKFVLLIYNDSTLHHALPQAEADAMMRECLTHADELRREGHLIESQMLEGAEAAKSLRTRNGRSKVTDGPFSE